MRGPPLSPDIDRRIVEAADRLLARYGYRKMTIDDLAEEVGIGKGTVYLRFPSKEEIVLATVDRIVDQVVARLDRIATSRLNPPAKLRRMLVFRVMHRFNSVQHYTESLEEVLRDLRSDLLERRQRYFAREARPIEAVLKQGRKQHVFRRLSPRSTAHLLLAATNSLLPFSLSTRELGTRKRVETTVRRIAALLIDGLKAKPPKPKRRRH